MGNDSILPECGGLSDYSDTKERKEMPQGQMVSFYLRFRFGHSYVPDNSYSWGTYSFSVVPAGENIHVRAEFCRDNGGERTQEEFDTAEDVFAALTNIGNTEKIYLTNGVYKINTALGSSWDLRIVHEGDQQVSGHGERGASGVPADLSVFIPYFKNLCERNVYPFIGTAQETQQR